MARNIKVWFDPEGDFLEVLFSDRPGYMRPTADDALMERVDEEGHILGFSILNVRELTRDKHPFQAVLPALAG